MRAPLPFDVNKIESLIIISFLDQETLKSYLGFYFCGAEKSYQRTYYLHAIWSYKERWNFSTTEALCTGSLNFPKNTNFPPFLFLKIAQI